MLGRNAGVKERAESGRVLAVKLSAQDRKFRKQLLAAISHSAAAKTRARKKSGSPWRWRSGLAACPAAAVRAPRGCGERAEGFDASREEAQPQASATRSSPSAQAGRSRRLRRRARSSRLAAGDGAGCPRAGLVLPLTGGCGRGAVRFEVDEPPVSASYCHRTRRQRPTGAAASPQARVAPGSFRSPPAMSTCAWEPEGGFAKMFCGPAALRSSAATRRIRRSSACASAPSTRIRASGRSGGSSSPMRRRSRFPTILPSAARRPPAALLGGFGGVGLVVACDGRVRCKDAGERTVSASDTRRD